MNHFKLKKSLMSVLKIVLIFGASGSFANAATSWITPTPEELSMTSDPHAPNAPAIYLNFDEFTEDRVQSFTRYVRMKILSEEGRRYGDVEVEFSNWGGQGFNADEVEGRTIHPDGTIIPFTGKPMERVIAKHGNARRLAKVFSLPDVQAGSIIEYRYKIRWTGWYFRIPVWLFQLDQFARSVQISRT